MALGLDSRPRWCLLSRVCGSPFPVFKGDSRGVQRHVLLRLAHAAKLHRSDLELLVHAATFVTALLLLAITNRLRLRPLRLGF